MTNTFRRIYKQNMQLARSDEYPSAPEHHSSNSENTPDSPIKNFLYTELDRNSQARSMIKLPINSNSTMNSINSKNSATRRNRHRRLGSGEYSSALADAKQVKMVNIETQTEAVNECSPMVKSAFLSNIQANRGLSASLSNLHIAPKRMHMIPAQDLYLLRDSRLLQNRNHSLSVIAQNDGMIDSSTDSVDGKRNCDNSNDKLDYSNSNEQLEMRESSDEDNLEKLGERVSQFFNDNPLLYENNGNGPITCDRLLFNLIAGKRSCVAINNKDHVTIISRGDETKDTPDVYQFTKSGSTEEVAISKDHNSNNDDGDDEDGFDECWTDDEADDSDNKHTSLRRKRYEL